MYRVFYVEDEILERENQRESWIWKTGEFQLCGDAANGKDAWEQLKKLDIDILITDIKMPFMDGIELSRLVTKHMPHIKIIILSGYSEFTYAQQALGIGVAEYIVKPLRSTDLLDTIRNVSKQIDIERSKNQSLTRLQRQADINMAAQIQKLLDDLSLGIFSSASLEERARELNIDLRAKYYISAIIEYAEYKLLFSHDDQLLALDVQKAVRDIVDGDSSIFVFHHELQDIRLIFKDNNTEKLQSRAEITLNKIRAALIRIPSLSKAVISTGQIREGYFGISESFADAKLILSFKYLYSDNDIVVMESSILNDINQKKDIQISLNTEKNLIDNLLKFGTHDEIPGVVDKLTKKMSSLHYSLVFYQYTCMSIIKNLQDFLEKLGVKNIQHVIKIEEDPFSIDIWLKWSHDIASFTRYLEKTLCHIIDIRESQKNYKYNNVILAAKEYIDENYSDPSLNLNDIASYVNISNSYFSTLFSQEMGESYIDYLTHKRIERAKELLKTTSMRLTDIAFEVGYQDSNYFSKIFKKLTNESPRKFRG